MLKDQGVQYELLDREINETLTPVTRIDININSISKLKVSNTCYAILNHKRISKCCLFLYFIHMIMLLFIIGFLINFSMTGYECKKSFQPCDNKTNCYISNSSLAVGNQGDEQSYTNKEVSKKKMDSICNSYFLVPKILFWLILFMTFIVGILYIYYKISQNEWCQSLWCAK